MKHLKLISIIFALLIISLPICFATEINLQTDANGNLETGDGFYRQYNSLNQLYRVYNGTNATGTPLEEYTYDPIEERVAIKKDYVKNETTYYFTPNNVRVVKFNGSVYNYTYAYHEGQLIAQINPDGSKYFIHGNHEGSSSVITNESGAVIESTNYDPYGTILSGGNKTRYNSEGKEYDSVVKSTNFNFRQQGIAGTPLFQQPDTLISNVYNPQDLNRYSFELNNPMKNKDPTGHCTWDMCAIEAWAIGFFTFEVVPFVATESPEWIKEWTFEGISWVEKRVNEINDEARAKDKEIKEKLEKAKPPNVWGPSRSSSIDLTQITKSPEITKSESTSKHKNKPTKSDRPLDFSSSSSSYEVTKADNTKVIRTYDPKTNKYHDEPAKTKK